MPISIQLNYCIIITILILNCMNSLMNKKNILQHNNSWASIIIKLSIQDNVLLF